MSSGYALYLWKPMISRDFDRIFRGKKSIHHHRGTPAFSVCRPPRGHRAKKNYGVCHFPGKTREKGIHHRSGKKGIHHEASDPKKEKRRVSTVVVYTFFFPDFCRILTGLQPESGLKPAGSPPWPTPITTFWKGLLRVTSWAARVCGWKSGRETLLLAATPLWKRGRNSSLPNISTSSSSLKKPSAGKRGTIPGSSVLPALPWRRFQH